ncbi:MAG TPA: hypothetical protein VLJ16_03270 [Acidobacteriota bacterium]|nr:hypothetical protein [Acidobacteriota bacterium]
MKRQALTIGATLAVLFGAGTALAATQADFKVPFSIKAAGKNLAAGDYAVTKTPEGGFVLKQVSTGKEIALAVLERIRPEAPAAEPKLVFDEVGDFAPSYTEYMTVYVLSEIWLPGEDGYRVHLTKGAHKTKAVTGAAAK